MEDYKNQLKKLDEIVDKMDTNEVRKKCKFRMLVIKALNQVEN